MATVEYDLDLTGGLMDEIRRLVAPPQTDKDRTKRHRVQDRQQQRKLPGKTLNHDCCDSCKEGGDLLCCDRCSAAFHLQCHDPPLDEDDVPTGQWLCHKCLYRPSAFANSHDSQDEETASNCSSRSRHSELTKYRPSTSSLTANSGAGVKPVTSSTPVPRSFHTEHDDNLADLEFTADEIMAGSRNPLLLLSAAARQLNPRQFDLPKDVTCPISFPGSSKFGKRKTGTVARAAKKSVLLEMENGLVSLPAKLCFVCGRSCRAGLLLQCDYCPLLFHWDCLNPPLTALPSGRWMCPNHVEHALDERLLTSVRLSERILLWSKFCGSIDPHTIKVDFLKKVHRTNPPFQMKCRPVSRHRPLKVPSAVKQMYSVTTERAACSAAETVRAACSRTAGDVATAAVTSDGELMNTASHNDVSPAASSSTSTASDASSVEQNQRQWLQSIAHLNAEISKFLSAAATTATSNSTVLPSPAKPMASVMPQVHSNSVTSMMTEPASKSQVPAAMETETDESENAALVEMLQDDSEPCNIERRSPGPCDIQHHIPGLCNIECSSRGPCDSDVCDSEHCSPGPRDADMRDSAPGNTGACEIDCHDSESSNTECRVTCHSQEQSDADMCDVEPSRPTAESVSDVRCDPSDCCNVNALWNNDSDNLRSAGCCHSNEDVTSARCSDYEAASVLSEMQQLAAAATSPAPSTNFTVVGMAAAAVSPSPGTSLNVVSTTSYSETSSVDCEPVVPPSTLSLVSASVFSNVSTQAVSGAAEPRVRAVLLPLMSDAKPVAMYQKCLTLGTGPDADVCLSDIGRCQRTSSKHAVIFYDQWSHQFELLNYSEFGSMVDDVRYACDVSVVSRSASSTRLSRQRPSSTNSGIDELRQLMASHASSTQDKNDERNISLSAMKPVSDTAVCACVKAAAAGGDGAGSAAGGGGGWEGSACLHHGSMIRLGCLQFSFHMTDLELLLLQLLNHD